MFYHNENPTLANSFSQLPEPVCTDNSKARPEILAFIPARSGSKGLVSKNLADLGGAPLVAHAIRAAKRCPYINRVVVSTDSKKIAAVGRDWGADVPFLRPANLSGDTAIIGSALEYTLDQLKRREGYRTDAVSVLFPTHPFRSPAMMNELTHALVAGYSRVKTVKRITVKKRGYYKKRFNGVMERIVLEELADKVCYRSYGIFDGFYRYPVQGALYLYELKGKHELIDIDSQADLLLARQFWPKWEDMHGGLF